MNKYKYVYKKDIYPIQIKGKKNKHMIVKKKIMQKKK